MQITVTNGDSDKPTEIITVITPTGDNGFKYTDGEGDRIAVFTADIDGIPGVYFRTDPNGCAMPLADLEAFISAVRDKASEAAHNAKQPCPDEDCGPCSFDRAFSGDGQP